MTSLQERDVTGLSRGPIAELTQALTRYWWLLIVTGVGWLVVSIVVFRFDYDSVRAVSVLFGVIALATAANEVMVGWLIGSGWRFLHLALAVLLALAGIVSFIHPGDTFVGLASVVSFYLIFRGSFDLVVAFSLSGAMSGWWVLLFTGVAELLIGFWAAGSWGLSATLLVAWVGATALLHGLSEIVGAFQLRDLGRDGAAS
jgi:uncharacterized membrane protein HdeD (DUF308 family)